MPLGKIFRVPRDEELTLHQLLSVYFSLHTDLRASSINVYITKIKSYYRIFKIDNKIHPKTLLEDADTICKNIKNITTSSKLKKPKKLSDSTLNCYYSSFMCLSRIFGLKHSYSVFKDHFSRVCDRIDKNKKPLTVKKLNNWISYDALQDVYKQQKAMLDHLDLKLYGLDSRFKDFVLPRKYMLVLRDTVMLSLFLSDPEKNPPRRCMDYARMKRVSTEEFNKAIEKGETHINYLIEGDGYSPKFVFCNYKTKQKYGITEVPLNLELNKMIKLWFRWGNKTNWLFPQVGGSHIRDAQFSRNLGKIIDKYYPAKRVSVNMFRNIIISNRYKDVPSYEDMEKYATLCGHSVNTMLTNYKQSINNDGMIKQV